MRKTPPVIRALRHREFLDDVAPFIAKVAEVVAEVDIANAEELVRPMGAPARDMALARVATVAARADSDLAERIALTVISRPSQTQGQDGWKREEPPPPSTLAEPNQAMYWKVRALIEIAIATAGSDRSARPRDYAGRFARSIVAQGTLRDVAPTTAEAAAAQIDPDRARQLLAEAEQWARAIGKSDLQAVALTRIRVAAAEIDPDHAGQLLTEAERDARIISGASARLEILGM